MNHLSNNLPIEPSQPSSIPGQAQTKKNAKNEKINQIVKKWIDLVSRDALQLWYASPEIRNFKEVVLAAVSNSGSTLAAASKELQSDRKIVLAAVNNYGGALFFSSQELQDDREIVLAAVKNYGEALSAGKKFQNDREIVLAAVKNNGKALYHASTELRNDPEIVLAAVKNNGEALEYGSEELRNNKNIVLAAVKNHGEARQFASEGLKNDRNVILSLVHGNGNALKSLSNELQNDEEIVLAAVKNNGDALSFASEELKSNKEIVLAAVKSKGNAIKFADKGLQKDKEVALAAIVTNPEAMQYVNGSAEQLLDFIKIAARTHGPNMLNCIRYASITDENQLSEIINIACPDLAIQNKTESNKIIPSIEKFKENELEEIESYNNLIASSENENFGTSWLTPSQESLFADTDLIIFPDDYLDALPLNGIKASELKEMEKNYNEVIRKFTIKGSDDFKNEVLDCLKILMTRPVGRGIIKRLDKQSFIISDGTNFSSYSQPSPSGRLPEINFGANPDYHFITETPQGKRKLIFEQIHLQNTITLAHELIHYLHPMQIYDSNTNTYIKTHDLPPTISPRYHNIEEERTITGWRGKKLPKYPETSEQESSELQEATQEELMSLFNDPSQGGVAFDFINENTLRSEFLLAHRVDHYMTSIPKNLILSPEEEVPREIVGYLQGIFSAGLETQFASFLSLNQGIDFAKMTTYKKEPFNSFLITAILESNPPNPISIKNFFEMYQKHKS